MRIYICIFLIAAFFAQNLGAKPVTKAQAQSIANEFMNKGRKSVAPLRFQEMPQQLMRQMNVGTTTNQPFYIFNVEDNGGFVIVSGDDDLTNILGYANSGCFDMEDAPVSVQEWMKVYANYVKAHQANPNSTNGAVERVREAGDVIVQPLLGEINWGQDYPFNEKCPTYISAGKTSHYYTGCVVAAATQIMKYHEYPQRGNGSKSYLSNGKTLTANFGETTYDWKNMPPVYPKSGATQSQIDAGATLAAQFGVAVEMTYEEGGSGAYTMLVPEAFRNYFGYDKGVNMCVRDYYSSNEWMTLIKTELDAKRPVYYGGTSDNGIGGHAFVCDGYDSNNYVHINWGWYGKSNGYFMMNRLNPDDLGEGGGSGGYNGAQEIIIGIQPPTGVDTTPTIPIYSPIGLKLANYETEISLLVAYENLDVKPFSGKAGALLVKDGKVLRVLKEETLSIPGFLKGRPGYTIMSLREVDVTFPNIEDGTYEIRAGYQTSVNEPWNVIRHCIGFVNKVGVEVRAGEVTITEYQLKPDVTLLEKITTDGALYAKGSGMFRLKLRNNSKEMRLKKVILQFRSKSDPTIVGADTVNVNVYEETTETLNLMMNLDDKLTAGEYEVTVLESGYPDVTFDDTEVGRTVLTLLPGRATPVIRMAQPIEWKNANGSSDILQGDFLSLGLVARNYGAAGKVALITYMEDVNDANRKYVFQQQNMELAKGKEFIAKLYKKLPLDPGTYRVSTSVIAANGEDVPVESSAKECIITVKENPNVLLNIVSLDFPDELVIGGGKVTGSITLQAPKKYSGMVYVRMRQLTIKDGELAYMGSQSINAGESKTISFNYTPGKTLVPGTYIVLIEAKSGSTEGSLGQYNENGYKIVVLKDRASGVTDVAAEEQIDIYPSLVVDKIYLKKNVDCKIDRAEIINIGGTIVQTKSDINNEIEVNALASGVYFLKLVTTEGVVVKRFIKK